MPMFVMPERIAQTDPFKAVTDATGSGPFRFVRDEWNPGSRAVWERSPHYTPRRRAGGRHRRRPPGQRGPGGVDRHPRQRHRSAALASGEQDYWEYPLHDLLPLLRRTRGVAIGQRLAQGTYCGIRLNHLQPPFDNPAVRRALLMAVDQQDYLRAVAGDGEAGQPPPWGVCESVYACGDATETSAGNDLLRLHSVDRAAAALRASGYKGERAVILAPSDYPQINALSLVTADLMRRVGFTVDLAATDWGTVTQRRTSKEPVERGGWSVFHSTWCGADVHDPAVSQQTRTNRDGAWFGWPEDAEIEALRARWLDDARPGGPTRGSPTPSRSARSRRSRSSRWATTGSPRPGARTSPGRSRAR